MMNGNGQRAPGWLQLGGLDVTTALQLQCMLRADAGVESVQLLPGQTGWIVSAVFRTAQDRQRLVKEAHRLVRQG